MNPIISHQTKSQLSKIFWITIAWTIIALFQFMIGYTTVNHLDCNLTGQEVHFYFYGSLITGLLAGTIGGTWVVFLWEKWLRTKNYGLALFNLFWSYCIIYILVSMGTGIYQFSLQLDLPIFHPKVWQEIIAKFYYWEELFSFIFWLVVVLATLIVLLVSDKYGPGIFLSFITGKYFEPKREERIFMFLDLRSSTTIAEKLGEVQYFSFIKNVFKDVTPAILNHKGEIYQYVGDEIIISWKMNNGLENANCIQCFFEIQEYLLQQKSYYTTKFEGIQPEFKAGLHYGHVMAGEIGVVKRDIAFSGDVLNTTARIQSKCNDFGVNILISKFLLDKLSLTSNLFHPKRLGDILLRGKKQSVVLYTL